MWNGKIWKRSIGLSLSLSFFPALAQDGAAGAGPGLGARSTGAGLTGLADPLDAALLQRNLAALSLIPHYDVVAGIGFGPDSLFVTRAAAMDSRTSVVTLGVSWYRFTDKLELSGADLPGWQIPGSSLLNPSEHWGLGLGFAYPFLDRRFSLGMTGRYDWQEATETGKASGWNLGLVIAAAPIEGLTLAFGARDLIPGYRDTTRSMDLGARWSVGGTGNSAVALEVDATLPWIEAPDWSKARLGAGATLGIVQAIFLRGGWLVEGANHDLTLGLGFGSEHASIDYGVRLGVGEEELPVWHALDLRVMF
jgi:hypothetical protein